MRKQKTILIVDGLEDFVFVIEILLQNRGYQTISAVSAAEALKKIKNHKANLIIAGNELSDMGGVRLIKEIRKIDKTVPIVMMIDEFKDAKELRKISDKIKKAGANKVVLKLFESSGMLRMVDELMLGEGV